MEMVGLFPGNCFVTAPWLGGQAGNRVGKERAEQDGESDWRVKWKGNWKIEGRKETGAGEMNWTTGSWGLLMVVPDIGVPGSR